MPETTVIHSSSKYPRQRRADLGLSLGEQARPADERHLDAGAGEHLGELCADIASAHDEQRTRQFLEVERGRAGQIRHGLDAGNGGGRRFAPVATMILPAGMRVPFTSTPPSMRRAGPSR